MLNWRSLECPANRYLVKGSELAVAIVGPQSRFAIYEVRTREADGFFRNALRRSRRDKDQ